MCASLLVSETLYAASGVEVGATNGWGRPYCLGKMYLARCRAFACCLRVSQTDSSNPCGGYIVLSLFRMSKSYISAYMRLGCTAVRAYASQKSQIQPSQTPARDLHGQRTILLEQ